jgi:hypothetical protein
MITAVFSRKGQPIPTVISQELGKLSEEHTKLLADEHKKELDKNIDETRVRVVKNTGLHLKDQIQVEKIENGYGVGNIETLNQKAPWWAWINFGRAFSGRTVPPGTDENPRIKGHFEPSSKGIFVKGQPKFPMNPKKAISAHNYIERALGSMLGKVRQLIGGR